MGLLSLLTKSKTNKSRLKQSDPKHYDFVLAKGYRGFKKYHMTVYGDPISEKNNSYFFNSDLCGKQITFLEDRIDGELYLQVMIEGKKVGAIFDEDQVKSMTTGQIEGVYAKTEIETVVGSKSVEKRPRIRLFVKYLS